MSAPMNTPLSALTAKSDDAGASAGRASEPGSLPALPEDALIIIPVRGMVLFPGLVLPVTLGRERSIAAAQEAARLGQPIGLVLQRDPEQHDPAPGDLHAVGTSAAVVRYLTAPDGAHHIIVQGQHRFRVIEFLEGWPFLVAKVELIGEAEIFSTEIEARVEQLKERAVEVLKLLPNAPQDLAGVIQGMRSPSGLADLIAGVLDIKPTEKQDVLETFDVRVRLDTVLAL